MKPLLLTLLDFLNCHFQFGLNVFELREPCAFGIVGSWPGGDVWLNQLVPEPLGLRECAHPTIQSRGDVISADGRCLEFVPVQVV